jgi:hypothetical protein
MARVASPESPHARDLPGHPGSPDRELSRGYYTDDKGRMINWTTHHRQAAAPKPSADHEKMLTPWRREHGDAPPERSPQLRTRPRPPSEYRPPPAPPGPAPEDPSALAEMAARLARLEAAAEEDRRRHRGEVLLTDWQNEFILRRAIICQE